MNSLANIDILGKTYNIKTSKHILEKMAQINIDRFVIVGNILSLGKKRIQKLQDNNEDAIVIDDIKNINLVIAFDENTIELISIIERPNIFVKNNTSITTLD